MTTTVDGTELYMDAVKRVRELEQLNSTLAAEVDRMRPVVDAAIKWNRTNYRDTQEVESALYVLGEVCDEYEKRRR